MTSIGETLRGERVRRHLDIQGIAQELKIPAKFLEAIEQEQFDRLPAAVFAKSFLRQYARYLGLHEEDLVNSLSRVLDPPPSMSEHATERYPSPAIQVERMAEWESVGERRGFSSSLPALAMVVVVMLACSGVYAWLQRSRHTVSSHEQSQASAALPNGTASLSPVARTAPPPNAAEAAAVQPPQVAAPAPSNTTDPAKPADGSPAASPVAAAATPPGPVHVEVTATGQVWVLAKADDKTSFAVTLEPTQSRTVDAQKTVTLRLGNAGGAAITLNGKPIGSVGPKGQPCTVQFTSGGFQIVASSKPADLLDPLREPLL